MFVRKKRRGTKRRPVKRAGKPLKAKVQQAEIGQPMDQRHLDLIGLGCVLLGIYLAFVLYLGWDGGKLGTGVRDGLEYMFGLLAFTVPIALFAAAAIVILRPALPAVRPLRTGAALLAGGLLLALAAGTLGLAGGRPENLAYFDPGWFSEHGGLLGESLYWVTATLLQPFGAHLIAVFAILGGILLLTGTTIAAVLSRSSHAIRKAGTSSAEATRVLARRGILDETETVVDGDAEGGFGGVDDRLPAFDPETGELTAEVDLPEADPSSLQVDIWGEAGEGEGISDKTEKLEPIAIFDDSTAAGPDAAEAGREGEGASGKITGDFDDELAVLEDEVKGEDATGASDPEKSGSEMAGAQNSGAGAPGQLPLTPMGKKRGATTAAEVTYRNPPLKALDRGRKNSGPDPAEQKVLARKLVETLGHFGVEASIIGVVSGPHVSRFELQLAPGTKVKKVSELANDLAYALASTDIRILAPIPGKQAVGVEVPNSSRNMVKLGDIYGKPSAKASPLLAWLGKGIDGKPVSTDLATMPHVLVAGTTGSGKSGCVNAILSSILMHSSPNEVRLVLVDPKQVELNHYEAVPHLLTPVVTAPKLAANVLSNLIAEMETRYGLMKSSRARNITDYNAMQEKAGEPTLPHILCVIDELADLMMVAPADVEASIIRLAQKSRATGIHLVLATQRPSTDIITGTIKVNIPSRIAFAVSSQTDSRVILDQGGAEALLGQGDMLFRGPGTSKLQRIQGAFVSEEEIARITDFWSAQGEPEFEQELLSEREPNQEDSPDRDVDPDQDDLLDQAIQLVVDTETASVSMIQRRLRVGYTRAGRLVDMLERRGVISGYEGSKPRQVLITAADLPRVLGGNDPVIDAEPEEGTGNERRAESDEIRVHAGDAGAESPDPGSKGAESPNTDGGEAAAPPDERAKALAGRSESSSGEPGSD